MRKFMIFVLLLAATSAGAAASHHRAKPSRAEIAPQEQRIVVEHPVAVDGQLVAAWVQYGPEGAEARAVVSGKGCPEISIDGRDSYMSARAEADGQFPLVCSFALPAGAGPAALVLRRATETPPPDATDGKGMENLAQRPAQSAAPADLRIVPLPLPVPDPRRVVVFGDTGCRILGAAVQDCSDPEQWPFARIAAEAARLKPDLVIHVGDYLYRESACPPAFAGCAGSPRGDNWPAWDADFFAPAKPLLAASPWVVVRGNHEECDRAGPGWLRLLGPAPYGPAAPCVAHLPPYSIPLAGLHLVVMDDANAPEAGAVADRVPIYRNEIASLAGEKAPVWLLLHRPIWGAVSGPLGIPVGGNLTLIEAAGSTHIPSSVELMLSGHIHSFEAINYGRDDRVPPQIVAGLGGDLLEATPSNLGGAIFQGHSGIGVADGISVGGFGFLLMTRTEAGWTIEVRDPNGRIERQCAFRRGRIDCPAGRPRR